MNQSINPNPRVTVNYLDKEEFRQALSDYKTLCEKHAPEIPQVPEQIGKYIVLIATNLARRPNFSGYSWRDDMIGDAIETCIKYVRKFDPDRGTSPLAYFSQVCWYCFIGRITSEKKQSKIKRELVRYANFESFSLQDHDDGGEFNMQLHEFLSGIGDDTPDVKVEKEIPDIVSPLADFME